MFRYVLVLLFSLTPLSYALDPPEVLLEMEVSWGDYANVGDQNNDGSDDLLISYDGPRENYEAMLLYGGSIMDSRPDWTYPAENDTSWAGRNINFIGKIDDNHSDCFSWVRFINAEEFEDTKIIIDLLYGNDELDDQVDTTLTGTFGSVFRYLGTGYSNNGLDLNDDGYNEMIVSQVDSDSSSNIEIIMGGESFDLEPDWSFEVDEGLDASDLDFSGGYDVNGDGYQDMLMKIAVYYYLFLGGEEVSEEPALTYYFAAFQGDGGEHQYKHFDSGFAMVPDMNGDGYADWAHHWTTNNLEDGLMVFYGGDEPDLEPDFHFDGLNQSLLVGGNVAAGDFNGDGYGDIVYNQGGANWGDGQINFYFGEEELSREADLEINSREIYEGNYSKKVVVGDFNGDGSDDIAIGGGQSILTILAGWKNESVEYEPVPVEHELNFTAYPNPFNSSVELSFTLGFPSRVNLSIYDIQGRLVEQVVAREMALGDHTLTWSAERAGVYLVRLESEGRQAFRKIVALK